MSTTYTVDYLRINPPKFVKVRACWDYVLSNFRFSDPMSISGSVFPGLAAYYRNALNKYGESFFNKQQEKGTEIMSKKPVKKTEKKVIKSKKAEEPKPRMFAEVLKSLKDLSDTEKSAVLKLLGVKAEQPKAIEKVQAEPKKVPERKPMGKETKIREAKVRHGRLVGLVRRQEVHIGNLKALAAKNKGKKEFIAELAERVSHAQETLKNLREQLVEAKSAYEAVLGTAISKLA
jgi:hypothetical protein